MFLVSLFQIDVLPEIVEAVQGKVEVFLDGGVRKGTDVLKALALGAKAVFIGRPVLWGLAYQVSEGKLKCMTLDPYAHSSALLHAHMCICVHRVYPDCV